MSSVNQSVAGAAALGLAGFLALAPVAQAAEEPVFINYGAAASPRQGDNDHRQVVYLSVPADLTERLYLRLFDPDTGGRFDEVEGRRRPGTTTRFVLFGGDGAFVPDAAQSDALSAAEMTSGTVIAEQQYRADSAIDGTWQILAAVDPSQGQRVGDRLIFRLLIDATAGRDGNVYDIDFSLADGLSLPPRDLRMFSYSTTVRMPRRGVLTELRFTIPDSPSISIGNFDAASGTAFLTTRFVSVPLTASGQNEWQTDIYEVPPEERGASAAITISGGREYPNDATFHVIDAAGHLVPFELPARVFELNERPAAVAEADLGGTCTTVRFDGGQSTDPEGDPLRYVWRFGDGTSEIGPTVVHDYRRDGRFTARLEVSDPSRQLGNSAAATVDVFVKRPPVAHANYRALVGAGEETTFDGAPSTASDWQVVRHEWDFGDGSVLVGRTVSHTYVNPGEYTVTHRIEDNSGHPCNRATETFTVRVNAQPLARAGSDIRVAIGQDVIFDGIRSVDPDGAITAYRWTFGDGASGDGRVVHHSYARAGSYVTRLLVIDDSNVANSEASDTITVIVNDPPLARAGADRSAAIGEALTFDAGESLDRDGAIIAYEWDFGDGDRGYGPTPDHSYFASGLYTVTLTVTDDFGTSSRQTTDTLSVRVNQPPVARAGEDQWVTASAVQFDGGASSDADDSILRYDWSFGDGVTGSGPRPVHVYDRPGTYEVRLTVTDASGTIRNTASDALQVIVNARPIADAGPDLVGAPGESLVFDAGRSLDPDGSLTHYAWDFRDGTTGSGKRVQHAFTRPGTYAVRLRVSDNTGHAEATDFGETLVFVNANPVADAGADQAAVPGDVVRLSAAQSYDPDGSITEYRWDFADLAEPLFGAEIERRFDRPGIYSAQLTVTDDSDAANALATDEVVIAINHAPVAGAGQDILTDGLIVTFDGSASLDADGDPLTYFWDFGDGSTGTGPQPSHTFPDGGTYPVVLTVDDGTGLANGTARDSMTVTINRPPVAVAGENQQVCTGDTIVFDGSGSSDPEGGVLRYAWDFGDGTASEIVNPTKSYLRGGIYPVTLTVRDDSGQTNGVNASRISIRVDQGPIANAGADILACANTDVRLDGAASTDIDGVVNSYAWDFGDGSFGGGVAPSHVYTRPGDYRVFLSITGESAGICEATSTDEVAVKIIEGPVARIAAPAALPVTDVAVFDGTASSMADGNIIRWSWNFGDGQTAEGARVQHRYAAAGTYAVTLTLTSDSASPTCQRVAANHLITINDGPIANAGPDRVVAPGTDVVFNAGESKDPDGGIIAYQWDFGDGQQAAGMEVRHRFEEPGIYTVLLTVRDQMGLPNSIAGDTTVITVNAPPEPVIEGPASVCVDETVAWNASRSVDPDSDIRAFEWRFGDGAIATGGEIQHRYEAPGRYTMALIADDGAGMHNSFAAATSVIHVNRPPQAAAGPDRLVCPGDTVTFNGGGSRDPDGTIARYDWDFGDGEKAQGMEVTHAFSKPGRYRVSFTATDDSGSHCASGIDTLDVVVNAPPVADAGGDGEAWIGGANDAVLLDGSASHDPDGQALSFSWQIGDQTAEIGERVRHAFTAAGDVPVTLTVSDPTGLACGSAASTVHYIARTRP